MSRKKSNVVKMNKQMRTAKLNAAIIIFFIIFVYVAASVVRAWAKTPITTYKVSSSNINNNISVTGIAVRNELQVTSSKSGYLIYFVREGDKVRKSSPVCTVDETKTIINAIENTGEEGTGSATLTKQDYIAVRNAIDTYKNSYSDVNFSNVYNFKANIESKVLELSNQVMRQEVNAGGATLRSTLENINAPESGIIAYYVDGYENYTIDTITSAAFNKNEYKKTSLKTGDILDAGSTVFKVMADENWSIVCQLTKDQATTLGSQTYINFMINKHPNDFGTADFRIDQRDNSYFLVLNLDKYMIEFIDDRFLSIEIIMDKYEGLKVPNSAIIDKEVYKIPEAYVYKNADNERVIKVVVTDEEGNQNTVERTFNYYRHEDDIYYVNSSDFSETDMIQNASGSDMKAILSLERDNLKGVYLANEGVAEFTEVEILKSQDEFTIINDGGYIKEFDNIVLDINDVQENQPLY
jgi:hypothetical protein